jgi:hypothetical protein
MRVDWITNQVFTWEVEQQVWQRTGRLPTVGVVTDVWGITEESLPSHLQMQTFYSVRRPTFYFRHTAKQISLTHKHKRLLQRVYDISYIHLQGPLIYIYREHWYTSTGALIYIYRGLWYTSTGGTDTQRMCLCVCVCARENLISLAVNSKILCQYSQTRL